MSKMICPIDCPNRRASPNCHNAATCETWAKHVEEVEQIRAAMAKQQKAGEDMKAVRSAYRAKSERHYDTQKRWPK